MEAHPRSLFEIFSTEVRLVVPLFQRPYVWDEDSQWDPLWEDILACFERSADPASPPHFMGAVVLEHRPTALSETPVREVIDGQQRLTTLQLVLAALRDNFIFRSIESDSLTTLENALFNQHAVRETAEELRFKLWPTNRDRAAFASVLAGAYRNSPQSSDRVKIAAGYIYFRDQIAGLLDNFSDSEVASTLDQLTSCVIRRLELVVIDLGPADNAQVIFETLNARGTPLRASDLIKNALFRALERGGQPVEELYRLHWEPLEAEPWQAETRVGRLTRPRLDIFTGYFLTIFLRKEVLSHQLFPQAKSYFGTDAERSLEFLQAFTLYAKIYDMVDTKDVGHPEENDILKRLEIADTSTLMPIILWLFADTSGAERLSSLRHLESFVVRRALCRLTPKNYNRLFLELLRRLIQGQHSPDDVVLRFLEDQNAESSAWPSDDSLRQTFEVLPLYRLLKKDRLQRLLLAFESRITSAFTEQLPTTPTLSIEHLLPQKWREKWPLPYGEEEAAIEAEARDRLVHTIGNLTIITGKLNSSASNADWPTKREKIADFSALTLNRRLPYEWSAEKIYSRSADLAKVAIEIWPRPKIAVVPSEQLELQRDLTPDREAPIGRGNRSSATPRPSKRRDIGAHIVNAFASARPGEFLTVGQIRSIPSEHYPEDDLPSAGAIQNRLFPPNGKPSIVEGIAPNIVDGRRGACRI